MGKLFGTDGVRGVANADLSCELALELGRAAAYVLTRHTDHRAKIIIGCDTRVSGDMLVNAMNGGEIDCIIAALSAPLQEDFIIKNKNLLDVRIFLGIGKTTLPVCRNGFLTGKIGQFLVKSIFKREIEKSRQK